VGELNSYLQTLQYADTPDYARLHELISILHEEKDVAKVESAPEPKKIDETEALMSDPPALKHDALTIEDPAMVDQQTVEHQDEERLQPFSGRKRLRSELSNQEMREVVIVDAQQKYIDVLKFIESLTGVSL
jgi:hypothetical protein